MAARPRPRLPADYLTRAATPVRPGAKHGALPRTTRRRSKRKRRRRFQPRRSAFTPAASQEAIAQSCENTRFGLDWFGWWLLGTRQGGSRIPSRAGHCWQGGGGLFEGGGQGSPADAIAQPLLVFVLFPFAELGVLPRAST